jgi:WD40 repeat protein
VSQKKVATMSPPFGGSVALSFSPDDTLVATADGDGFVRVYNANTGTLRGTPTEFLLEPFAVAFFPDGKSVLAGGADKAVSIIDPESGKVTRVLPKQSGVVSSLDVSADGKQAAVVYRSAESFLDSNHFMLWDLVKGIPLADFQKPGLIITGGSFVGDHYVLAAIAANQLTLWAIP